MATDVLVPTLGESITEATIARWLKSPGEAVKADEPLAELETDKVTLEVNAPATGRLAEVLFAAGASVSVGAVLARIEAGAAPTKVTEAPKLSAPALAPTPTPAPSAQVAAALDPKAVKRSAPGGKIGAQDLLALLGSGGETMPLSPAVQKLVAENKLDPARIPASGKGGRLTKEDILKALENPSQLKPAMPPAIRPPGVKLPGATGVSEERVKMSKLRQTIARRLKEAQNTAAMLTTFNEVDMGQVMALRQQHKDAFEKAHGVKLGFMSFFAKAVVAALKAVPSVNARLEGEEIVFAKHYDLGMAVSTPHGLMVPVIRNCDALDFAEIEKALGDLATRARDGKLALDELQGGTFTITNGGVFGSLLSTPILNPPQSGILGLHKIEDRPVARDGQVVIRPMMYVALSYDHRLIDGREAVTFLVKVKEAIEAPEKLLLGI